MSLNSNAVNRLSGWWGWTQTPEQHADWRRAQMPEAERGDLHIVEDDDGSVWEHGGAESAEEAAPDAPDLAIADGDAAPVLDAEPEEAPEAPPEVHPLVRLQCLQAIWGAGETRPGGRVAHGKIFDAAALPDDAFIFQVGSGLGGFAWAAAKDRNARVVGMDSDPIAVKLAEALSQGRAGADRLRFVAGSYSPLAVTSENADLVVAHHAFSETDDPADLAARLAAIAAPGAMVVAQDFFGDGRDTIASASFATTEAALTGAGLEIVDVRDGSKDLINTVVGAWAKVQDRLENMKQPPQLLTVMQEEAERWAAISAELSAGAMRFQTIYARRPAPEPKRGRLTRLGSGVVGKLLGRFSRRS